MKTVERVIVAGVVEAADGKILLAERSSADWVVYPGCWGILGGKVETGEDQRTALNREIIEEAGLDISPYPAELIDEASGEAEKTSRTTGEHVLHKMKFYTYKVVIAGKTADEIKITLSEEHTDYRWILPSELKNLKLTPPSTELFTNPGYL